MSPGQLLKEYILSYIKNNNLEESMGKGIPQKWEKYGDFILFDERKSYSEIWKIQDETFWSGLCEILKCRRIGIKSKIQNDSFRTPNVTILYGSDPWIFHKENSIKYTWNVERSMFSAGNASEKQRISKLNCENEVVVDLFAGIGYFTLPFLVLARAAFVHACEWNPIAVEALKRNLIANKVKDKCMVYEGDNHLVCPKKVGHRVYLGLLPTSENHWKVGCEALVNEGGILHIHENVETKKTDINCKVCYALDSQFNSEMITKNILMSSTMKSISEGCINIAWKNKQCLIKGFHILHSLILILLDLDSSKQWCCSIDNIMFVKSYAPNVTHMVYDVKVYSS